MGIISPVNSLVPPAEVGDLHLDAPLPGLNETGRYRAARLLVWLHGRPLGEVSLPLDDRPLAAGALAARLWPLVADLVAKHYISDGMPPPGDLPAGGLAPPPRRGAPCSPSRPASWRSRL